MNLNNNIPWYHSPSIVTGNQHDFGITMQYLETAHSVQRKPPSDRFWTFPSSSRSIPFLSA